MKKLFFLIHSMNVGGVEKAMLGVLSVLPLDQYEVHLGVLQNKGDFLGFVPRQVIIHEINSYAKYWDLINNPPLQTIMKMIRANHIIEAFVHLLLYIHFKVTSNRYWFYRYILRHEPKFPIAFDMAISFAGPSQMIDYYVYKFVDAPIKVGWIHFDISKFGIDKGMTQILYKKYKRIFIVSETGKEIFDHFFPQFSIKTDVFHNVVSPRQVMELAEKGESFEDNFNGKRILTVGRISPEKGQYVAIRSLKLLLETNNNLRWYFVGEGKDMNNCKKEVENLGLSDKVVFLGAKTNPYAYMRDCDIYMQPSRHEGFCITLAEALCFGNPIVATNFTGAHEQLKSRKNAFVVGMRAEDISSGIEKALSVPMEDIVCKNEKSDIKKLLSLLN